MSPNPLISTLQRPRPHAPIKSHILSLRTRQQNQSTSHRHTASLTSAPKPSLHANSATEYSDLTDIKEIHTAHNTSHHPLSLSAHNSRVQKTDPPGSRTPPLTSTLHSQLFPRSSLKAKRTLHSHTITRARSLSIQSSDTQTKCTAHANLQTDGCSSLKSPIQPTVFRENVTACSDDSQTVPTDITEELRARAT
jgi:hypothetical protein